MRRSLRTPRLEDVARLAKVSSATVSRFVNNPQVVAPETGERIQAAIVQTGFVPNAIAGSLATSRSRLVSVMIPDISPSVFNSTVEAMVDELSAEGQVVMIGLTGADSSRLGAQVDAALARQAEAIILTGAMQDQAVNAKLRARSTMVIQTWGLPTDPLDVAVGFSHAAVGEECAAFAIRRGYRQAHLVSTVGLRAERRREGFRRRWLEAGLPDPTQDLFQMPLHFGHGRAAFRAIRRMEIEPDLVVCSSDWVAQALIVEAQAAGLRVPDDLAVLGFGNMAFAAEMRPTITTIEIDGTRIARECVTLLRQRALGQEIAERRIDVGFRLIVRESA
jgi:LacI family gluconate utilization system Gnt-I transcriptional repressor